MFKVNPGSANSAALLEPPFFKIALAQLRSLLINRSYFSFPRFLVAGATVGLAELDPSSRRRVRGGGGGRSCGAA